MARLAIKALTVNQAYRGRHFSTPEHKQFKEDIWKLLPKMNVPKGKLMVRYVFGVSSKNSDGDNLIKAFQDCLATAYGFNDRMIYQWYVEKEDVKKGAEYIDFTISAL